MYYEARERALRNNDMFHLAAFANRGRTIGVSNTRRLTSKFRKRYSNSRDTHHEIHAEVDLILKMRVAPERINVVRFFNDGTPTMAKPCVHCQHFLRHKGVKVVRYTNWDGEWEEMRL